MTHRELSKLHGYIAVFFLPMSVLYAVTGALYIVGITGARTDHEMTISLPQGWPDSYEAGQIIVQDSLAENSAVDGNIRFGRPAMDTSTFYWTSIDYSISMSRISDATARVLVQKNSWYRKLVEIHKNHAGGLFAVLGFSYGLALFFLVVSGAMMMFQSKLHKRAATVLLSTGSAFSIIVYFLTTTS